MAGVGQVEATSPSLHYLDYIYPLIVAAVVVILSTFNACTVGSTKKPSKKSFGRNFVLCLTFVIVLSYVAQATLYLAHALVQKGWWAQQHSIINVLACILVWGCIFTSLLGSQSPSWNTYVGAWIVGLAFEVPIGALYFPTQTAASGFDLLRTALQGLRISCFLVLLIHAILLLNPHEQMASDEECQPFISTDSNGSASKAALGYGSITPESQGTTDEAESEDEDKEVKEQQRKRFEAQGWVGYLRGFGVFLPYIWPKGNLKMQLFLAVCFLDIVFHRFLNVLTPRQVGIITDKLTSGSSAGIIPWKDVLLWIFYTWFGSSAGFGLVKSISLASLENYWYIQLRTLAFNHVMDLSMDFHSSKDSGEVLKSVEQAESLNQLIELIFFQIGPVFIDMFVALGYITHLFDVYLAFVVIVVGIVYTWMGITLTARNQSNRRSYVEKDRYENKTLYESVSNWESVSYFNRVPHEQERYKGAIHSTLSAWMSYIVTFFFSYAAQSLVMTLGLLTASFLAIYQITSGQKPVGNFVTLVMYWSTMMSPLSHLADSWRQISATLVDAERLLQLLQVKPTVENRPGTSAMVIKGGQVDFKDVDFSFDSRKQTIKALNFTAKPGQTLAFVGETGGGKSTILKLLLRFYDVTSGSISIDGQDLRDVSLASLRDIIGIVPQDPALFNQTVMENVRYSRLEATDDEVIEACKAAAVHDKIMTFPDGYKSKCGERGVKLSGGELQRIAIARIFLKDPQIVLLDEATSAVDSSIESRIQAAFKKLSAGRTTFVIAHRLSTIMDVDLIIVIDQGQIIEQGTHDQLIHKHGKYSELWTKQTGGKTSSLSSIAVAPHDEDLLLDLNPPPVTGADDSATRSIPFE
jgi:ABC-type transport system involved in Fe-S cluster assembly fused permease/ATPase subunit